MFEMIAKLSRFVFYLLIGILTSVGVLCITVTGMTLPISISLFLSGETPTTIEPFFNNYLFGVLFFACTLFSLYCGWKMTKISSAC